jgi:hypothetical protein
MGSIYYAYEKFGIKLRAARDNITKYNSLILRNTTNNTGKYKKYESGNYLVNEHRGYRRYIFVF